MEQTDHTDSQNPALDMAASLGAEVEVRAGGGLVATALDIARNRNVTHLVVGRGRPARWRSLLGRTLAASLARQGPEFSLHVVPSDGRAPPRRRIELLPRRWWPWVASTALVALVCGAGEGLSSILQREALGMLFLAAVVASAMLGGLAVSLFTAVLSYLVWDLLFIPPIGRIVIADPRDVVAILVFLGVAAATGLLASRVRREAQAAQKRIESLRRISAFSRRLNEPATETDLLTEIARLAGEVASPALVLITEGEDIAIRAADPPSVDTMDEGSWAAARWACSRLEQTGRGTATLPSAAWRFLPLRTVRQGFGAIGIRPAGILDQPLAQTLTTLADQAASALERVRLTAAAARSEAQAETQRLRTALLNSLSHDLRTPLTGIRGAAGSLRTAWNTLPDDARRDLLASIELDVVRMTRFLANITEMTRLETGDIVPRLEPVDVESAVAAAAARVPGLSGVHMDMPADLPQCLADPALLEQVLVNLLENAAKYGPAETPAAVTARRAGRDLVLCVLDDGTGIAAADLPHVFDSFYRSRRGDRTIPGTGLGLAIAHGLTEAMGGTIAAFSPRPGAPPQGPPGTAIELRLKVA
jgi:two-component system sensor histidine kinase KdpD